ncbi:MAG: hypothetical protein Q8R34_01810 [bacterium]|nr:hypothetical protein [bacterium]
MIPQLDNELWTRIFLADQSVKREDIANSFSMSWDELTKVEHCALGVFELKPEKRNRGRFVLVRSFYQKSYDKRISFETNYIFSFAQNDQDALLEFLPELSKEEKEWLNVHLYLKDHPAYQG